MDYYLSPRWSGEVADCSMPMTFDQYNNCGYKCLYCFSTYQRGIGSGKESYFSNAVKPVSVKRIKKMFLEPETTHFGEYIERRMVMQWGGLSDPFCPFEQKYGVGLELLKFFREIDYPICFSTKGTWWLDDARYTDLFRDNPKWNVKVSIITLNEKFAKVIEKGTPTSAKRLEALEKIARLNCGGATLRFRPFMFGISNPGHQELVLEAGKRGATAVSLEFFCLEQRSPVLRNERLAIISGLVGFDYFDFYRKYSVSTGYLRLNRNIKRRFVDEIEAATREAGMRFYVSDAHFKERCDNGSCCGLSSDWNYSRGQFCEALVMCKKKGRVSWDDIEGNMEHLQNVMLHSAQNLMTPKKGARFFGFTLFDYMRWLWNHPKAGQSPYTMFEGVMKPVGLDENGDLIYELDRARL
ncbi:hypothetical protein ES708_30543 [subsurface metagenome]